MRTIKFRAWGLTQKRMFQVNKLVGNTGGSRVYGDWEVFEEGKEDSLRFYDKMSNDEVCLMQFTGLVDKNGKEIYEGDILRIGSEVLKVEWIEYAWWLRNGELDQYLRNNDALSREIIGNIYENPNLITL